MMHLLLFVLMIVLELLYFRIARHFNIKDKPNERSSHQHVTLLGGGVLFLFATTMYAIFFGYSYPWFLGGAFLLAVISFIDDLRPLDPRIRLFVHISSLLIMFNDLTLYTMSPSVIIIALLVATGMLNAYNFMDGINGMMGMTSLIVLGGMIYINASLIEFVDPEFLYLMLMAVLIFNFFNFRKKAYCFAGDVGAFTMGFIMVFLIARLIIATQNLAWIAMLAMFGVDTVLTIIHRLFLGEKITHPHRKHLFQILANELKISQLTISAGYALIQLVVIVGLILYSSNPYMFATLSVLILSVIYVFIKQKYFHLHSQQTEQQQ